LGVDIVLKRIFWWSRNNH